MILTMCCKVVFHKNERREQVVIRRVHEIEFKSSFKEIVSKGSISMPRNVTDFNKRKVRDVFQRGDALTIYFGYNGRLEEEFSGYISRVGADIPIKIEFEDEMFNIKQMPVNFSSKSTTLEQMLKTIVPVYKINALDGVTLGSVRLAKTQVGAVLDKLQSDWGLYTWMDGKTLVCGKYYTTKTESATVPFHLERTCVSTSLNYRRKDEVRVKIKAVSTLHNGKKISVDNIGDADGNERQLVFYNITVLAELKELGQKEYERFKQDRFDGSFTAFGTPSVKHGMKVTLTSSLYDDRNGIYYIEAVSKTFNINGIRQEITLGDKMNDGNSRL